MVIPDEAPAAGDPTVVTWFAAELAQVDAFLDELDPDVPTWNWAPQARVAAFWHRRMAHETAVHRWDAQLATVLPEPLESKLAADTVAEALDTFLPAGRRRSPSEVTGLVHLIATDLGQEWYVRLRGPGSPCSTPTPCSTTTPIRPARPHPARPATSRWPCGAGLPSTWSRRPATSTLLEALRVR